MGLSSLPVGPMSRATQASPSRPASVRAARASSTPALTTASRSKGPPAGNFRALAPKVLVQMMSLPASR